MICYLEAIGAACGGGFTAFVLWRIMTWAEEQEDG